MALKHTIENHFSLLSSIIYLRKELKAAGFEKAEELVGGAYYAFFEDLKSKEGLGSSIEEIKTLVEAIEQMPPQHLKQIINLLEFYETGINEAEPKNLN